MEAVCFTYSNHMQNVQLNPKNGFSVKVYQGDAKTLLAFNLPKDATRNLAGFTIQYSVGGKGPFYLQNQLRFQDPTRHVQDAAEPANSTINAPIHKFRWLHVPGSVHQGTKPLFGPYTYTVTPRYFDGRGSLTAIDLSLGATLTVNVGPFAGNKIRVGFARGFMQSQAFVHHFGPKAVVRPREFQFSTAQVAGKNSKGESYTFADEYEWLGYTARVQVFGIVDEVLADPNLTLDVFAYDLNEPDLCSRFLRLAAEGRIRVILDNADLHHTAAGTKPEDQFEKLFRAAAKGKAAIKRGKFKRYAHDKQLIVCSGEGAAKKAIKVLTGSTNFSVTGMYVNSNHVLVFEDAQIAAKYAQVFDLVWQQNVSQGLFVASHEAAQTFSFTSANMPKIEVAYSPHEKPVAQSVLQGIAGRIGEEANKASGTVFFAVMSTDETSTGPVFPALRQLHENGKVFSYGITDTTEGIALYKPGTPNGVLVTGRPASTKLPPPFDQVPGVGIGHQVHHKFVVCGFNTPKAVVYCGSSNLALGGEQENGDNLIAIHDPEIATVFMIEAVGLVDHFHFLDGMQTNAKAAGIAAKKAKPAEIVESARSASKQHQANEAGWFLGTTSGWVARYYATNDLHCIDRELFGATTPARGMPVDAVTAIGIGKIVDRASQHAPATKKLR